jgi:hypothetical protein
VLAAVGSVAGVVELGRIFTLVGEAVGAFGGAWMDGLASLAAA